MLPYIIGILSFVAFFLAGGATLNYATTGSIFRIAPGHSAWFWRHALGMGVAAGLLLGSVAATL